RRESLRRRQGLSEDSGRHMLRLRAIRPEAGGVHCPMSKRSKFIIILLLALTAAVIIYALFGMEHNVDTVPVELPTAEPTDSSAGPGGSEQDIVSLTPDTVQAVVSMLT